MNQVFNGQSLLQIQLQTNYALGTASELKILFKKPDGTKGSWNADADGSILKYDMQVSDIDQAGIWELQAYFEVGGRKAYGTIRPQEFTLNLS